MPTNRSSLTAAVVNDKIYLIGGLEKAVSTVPEVSCLNEVYDPERDAWTRAAPIPTGVYGYACAVVDNKIYIMAGQGADPDPQTPLLLQIYDTKTDTWSTEPSPPVMVVGAAAAATTGKWAPKRIYLIGGRINYSMDGSDIVQVYNIENQSWTIGASMPTARYAPAVAVINDIIYVIGGIETFNLHPPFGWTTANEQYIPFGYHEPTSPPNNTSSTGFTPQIWIATAIATTAIGGAILIVYFAKLRKQLKSQQPKTLSSNKHIQT